MVIPVYNAVILSVNDRQEQMFFQRSGSRRLHLPILDIPILLSFQKLDINKQISPFEEFNHDLHTRREQVFFQQTGYRRLHLLILDIPILFSIRMVDINIQISLFGEIH